MTIEFSLRRRAVRARYFAAFWLTLATLILVGTYLSLPIVAKSAGLAIRDVESPPPAPGELYSLGVLALGVFAIGFASFLLGRAAFVEIELAARFVALADALCLAGDNFAQLEKAVNVFVPGTKYLSVPEIFSTKDLGSVVEVLKELRPK